MNPLRLVLVTRRFWPLVGGAETLMGNLAAALSELGASVTILTARWQRDWPAEMVFREVPVVRLPQPGIGIWGTMRRLRSMRRWLKQRESEIDAVVVSRLRYDAYAVLAAMRKSAAAVLIRGESWGPNGDLAWLESAWLGRRILRRCHQADGLIAPSETLVGELQSAGLPRERIHTIPNGVMPVEATDPAQRIAARAALSAAHPILAIDDLAPLAVFSGRFHAHCGIMDLVECWPAVLQRWPGAKLWLMGEGRLGQDIWDRIKHRGLTDRVIMPGSFDQADELLQAADLFVAPADDGATCPALLEAMSAGVPVLAADSQDHRSLLLDGKCGRLVPPGDRDALLAALVRSLSRPKESAQLAQTARRHVAQNFTVERMAMAHLELIRRLVSEHRNCP